MTDARLFLRFSQPPGTYSSLPFEAFNRFTAESILILDVSATPGPLLPGSAFCDTSGGRPLLQAVAAARDKLLDECTPDNCRKALLLTDDDEQRAGAVAAWLLEEQCSHVFLVSRAAILTSYGFLFVDSVHALPVYPNEIVANQLYLGSAACANEAALDHLKITHVVSLVERNLQPPFGREHCLLQIPDADDAQLLPVLQPALRFLHAALANGGRVLVHCERGASRSVSVVCAHLMRSSGGTLGLADALQLVKAQRPCAQPNCGFLRQLEGLTDTVLAALGGEACEQGSEHPRGASEARR